MSRSLAIFFHFPGWQMMLQWIQQLLPGEWAGCRLSLASMLMRALCFWQSCSVILVVDSSLVKAQHTLSMFSFSSCHWYLCYHVVTSWISASLLKVVACTCRECQFSSLACDALCPSGGTGSLYRSSYNHNSYNTVTV